LKQASFYAAFFEPEFEPERVPSMNKLIFANLIHRPVRSLISVFAIAIEVVMILSIVAIMMGQVDDQKVRTNGIGADVMVWPSNASMLNGMGGAPMPAKNVEALRKLPHVTVAAAVNQRTSMTGGGLEVVFGVDFPTYNALRPFEFLSGSPFSQPNDVIVDDIFARSGKGYKVGDTLKVLNQPFRICGIVKHGKGARKVLPIETMNTMLGDEGKASLFYVKVDKPENVELVRNEIQTTKGFTENRVLTMNEWTSLMSPENLPAFNIAMRVVISIAVVVGILVIFQSMYTAVLERTREIGILKSLGASKGTIIGVVLRETIVLVIVGVLLGIATTYGIRTFMSVKYPTLFFELTTEWLIKGSVIAIVGSILGALYPATMAARKDPIDALAYE
jgi:putative ABC transport system permease protein